MRFLLQRNFFGLSDEYSESLYEQIFNLKYYGGWSLIELYNLPIRLRGWFAKKLLERIKEEAEASKGK